MAVLLVAKCGCKRWRCGGSFSCLFCFSLFLLPLFFVPSENYVLPSMSSLKTSPVFFFLVLKMSPQFTPLYFSFSPFSLFLSPSLVRLCFQLPLVLKQSLSLSLSLSKPSLPPQRPLDFQKSPFCSLSIPCLCVYVPLFLFSYFLPLSLFLFFLFFFLPPPFFSASPYL